MHKLAVLMQSYTITRSQVNVVINRHDDPSSQLPLRAQVPKVLSDEQKAKIKLHNGNVRTVSELVRVLLIQVEALYGASSIKPNMHFAVHLDAQLMAYGPPAGWWCNSYERYNGLLGAVPHTPSHIEVCVMRRFVMLIDTGIALSKYARDLPDINDQDHLSPVPTRTDCTFIVQILTGTAERDINAPSENGQLVQSMRQTPSGKNQHVYSWPGEHWSTTFKKFMEARFDPQNLLPKARRVPQPRPTKGDKPRFLGCEPFPGRLGGVRRYPQATLGFKHIFDTVTYVNADAWPKEIEHMITSEKLTDSLRTHFGLGYPEAIIGRVKYNDEWTDANRSEYQDLDQHAKLTLLESEYNFIIPSCIRIYTHLRLAGELFGSELGTRTHQSSYVGVFGPDEEGWNVLKYGRAKFYFTTGFDNQLHSFAVVEYYAGRGDGYWNEYAKSDDRSKYIDSYFPLLIKKALPMKKHTIIPVHTICFRWVWSHRIVPSHAANPPTIIVHAFPVASRIHG